MFWSTPARWTRTAQGAATSLASSRRRLVLPGRGRLELGGPSVRVTVVALIVRTRYGQGSAARREAPGGGRPRRAGTEALGQRLDTARTGDHLPGAGIAPRFTSTEVVYGVTGTGVTELPEYGVSP